VVSLERVDRVMAHPLQDRSGTAKLPDGPLSVVVDDLTVGYASSEAVSGMSFVVDPGETLEQAAARECMEESGYTVRTGPLLKALDLTSKNGLRRFSFFAAQVTGEVDEYETDRRRRWVPLTQLVDTVSEAFAPVARAARAYLSA